MDDRNAVYVVHKIVAPYSVLCSGIAAVLAGCQWITTGVPVVQILPFVQLLMARTFHGTQETSVVFFAPDRVAFLKRFEIVHVLKRYCRIYLGNAIP